MSEDKYKKIKTQIEKELQKEVPATEYDYYKQKAEEEIKYGDEELQTFGERAASAASFGLTDQFLVKQGLASPEDLRKREEYNPKSALAGEIVGTAAPIIASGGTSAVAKGVSKAGAAVLGAEAIGKKVGEAALKKLLKDKAYGKVTKKILEKTIPMTIGSSVEGAFYGAGQLIKEDALGTKEFNAENLLSAAGTGALIGGAAGGVFGGLSATVPIASKKAAEAANKVLKKTSDVTENTMDLLGVTAAAKSKLRRKHANLDDVASNAMQILKDNKALKYLQSTDNLHKGYSKVVDDIGDQIGRIYENLSKSGVVVKKKDFYSKLLGKVDDIIKNNSDSPAFVQDIKALKKGLYSDLNKLQKRAIDEEIMNASEIHKFIKDTDKKLQSFYKSADTDTNLTQDAYFEMRNLLKQEIDNIADIADPLIGQELKTLNKNYHDLKIFEPFIERKASKDRLIEGLGLLDYGITGSLSALGAPGAGGIFLGTKALLNSDLKRRVVILNNIEKSIKKTDSKIKSSLKNFFKKDISPKPFTATSTRILINSAIARQEGKKPKSKQEALQNIRTNINQLSQDPNKLLERIARNTTALSYAAPETAQHSAEIMMRQVQFLAEKLPTFQSKQGVLQGMIKEKTWMPSSIETAKFERYLEAMDNPLSALEDLESGTLSREKVEVLREIYPTIYQKVQMEAMEYITKDPEGVPYKKRIQLGTLLNIPADSSLLPENIGSLQANFGAEQEERAQKAQSESLGKYEALDMADDEMTSIEQVEKRN